LDEKVKESYTEDGKELFQIIQEWLNENNSFLYCKSEKEKVEYYCR